MPDEERGERQRRGDEEPPPLVERRTGEADEPGERGHEPRQPEQDVEPERLSLEQRVRGDPERERGGQDRRSQLGLPAHCARA
jgi:hypothetical protein